MLRFVITPLAVALLSVPAVQADDCKCCNGKCTMQAAAEKKPEKATCCEKSAKHKHKHHKHKKHK